MTGLRASENDLPKYKLIAHFVAGTTARRIAKLVNVNHTTDGYYFH
jgi:transposase-like protein